MTFKPSTTQHHKCLLTRKSFWTNINPFEQKNENENIIQVLLEVVVIHSNTSPYSSPMVMVLKEEYNWPKYLGFCSLDKVDIKDKFPIPFIYDIMHELHGANIFTKLDLRFGYH